MRVSLAVALFMIEVSKIQIKRKEHKKYSFDIYSRLEWKGLCVRTEMKLNSCAFI